ncbi:alpha/beta hydrolase [Alterisphingorhabdus coralli]|uniref:Alpha/beta hydrolase n=1 Tax=Alterisphingorhabdus coralli TaxID=3071408 RepID=A0AA97I0R6_9SPHN|nr:alpha/beta hydrolase [Parasphingorhabdus sp. SCSIO 66989]WOE74613.1 alpha/beta hydrolase [Parasphingorhabdus sp. SCSIO 66989]
MSATFDRRSLPEGLVEGRWTTRDGWDIRHMDWATQSSSRKGAMLFMAGRGDIYEKYLETLNHYNRAGWDISASDWRGQAASGRMTENPHVGHIDDFATWVADLAEFWPRWKAEREGPHVLMAHSMGGHLVARALIEGVVDPDAVILSAPMLGMDSPGGIPVSWGHNLAKLMRAFSKPHRPAWKVSEKPASPLSKRQLLLTHDSERYADEAAWWKKRPELVMGPASWHWVERAYASVRHIHAPGQWEKVQTPMLILSTSADQLVSHSAIEKAAERLPNARLVTYGKECAHELLREVDAVRDKAIAEIDAFLSAQFGTVQAEAAE